MAKEKDSWHGILPTKFGNLDIVNQFENQKLEKQASGKLKPGTPQQKHNDKMKKWDHPETPQQRHIEKMTKKSESNKNEHLKSILALKNKQNKAASLLLGK